MTPAASADLSASLPHQACDCHTHVIGPAATYPMAEDRQYTPGPASAEALRAHLQALGLARVVIVQPSVYGDDHRCLLDALAAFDGQARGVAAPSAGLTDAPWREWHAHGVRGLRVNLESGGQRDAETARRALERSAAQAAAQGWHLQVYADYRVIEAATETLAGLACPVVLDHFALAPATPDARATLRDLLRTGRVHLKLSAPYRLAERHDATRWAGELTQTAPSALLWGSDWPHTARTPGVPAHGVSAYRDMPAATLARDMLAWLPTRALRQTVLADNPAALYWAS